MPESLYRQTALMIQHGILDLESIYDMLGPEDAVIQAEAEKEMAEAKEFVRKMNIVSTKDKEENEEKPQDDPTDDKKVFFNPLRNNSFIILCGFANAISWNI